jgi:hypothetical protein
MLPVELLQVPLPPSLKVTVLNWQRDGNPVIAGGNAFTVTGNIEEVPQPVE